MGDPTNFEFCQPALEDKWRHLLTSFGVCVPIFLMAKCIATINSNPPSCIIGLPCKFLTPCFALLGTMLFWYEEVFFEIGSLMNCGSFLPLNFSLYTCVRWGTVLTHCYFFLRTLIFRSVFIPTELFCSIVNIALFTQDVMALVFHQHLTGFQYMFLYNLLCPEVVGYLCNVVNKVVDPNCRRETKIVAQLCQVTLMLAGTLRVAEEWHTNENVLPGTDEIQVQVKSLWSYVYMTIITLSKVGYGDKTPSTPAGQFLMVVAIVFFMVWYSNITTSLYTYLEGRHEELIKQIERSVLVVGCKTKQQLEMFLKSLSIIERWEVMVYVDLKNTEFAKEVHELGLRIIQANDPKEGIINTFVPRQAHDLLFILPDPTLDSDVADVETSALARVIHFNHIEVTTMVCMN